MKTTLLSAAMLMLFAAGAARAEEGARPCKADMEKFCKDAGREKTGCMKEHEKDLSEGCKAQMAKGREGFMKQHPCSAEMQKLCAGMKPGDGKFAACLKEHEKDFSDACKADFAKRKEEMEKKNPCMADMEKFCKDVKPGKGGMMDCFKAHEAELSEGCKARRTEMRERMKKSGEGPRHGMARGKTADKPEPAAAPETSTTPESK